MVRGPPAFSVAAAGKDTADLALLVHSLAAYCVLEQAVSTGMKPSKIRSTRFLFNTKKNAPTYQRRTAYYIKHWIGLVRRWGASRLRSRNGIDVHESKAS